MHRPMLTLRRAAPTAPAAPGGSRRGSTPAEADPRESVRTGFWLYAGHLLTVWGLAASNIFHGLLLLWSILRAGRLRRIGRRLLADRTIPVRAIFVPAALAVALFTLSALTSLEPSASLPELRDLFSWATLFLAPLVVRGGAAARRVVDLLVGLIAVLAAHGIMQYYFTDYGSLHHRIVGLFSHYQTFAGVLLIGTLLLAARLATGSSDPKHRRLSWAAFAVVVWCLVLTLTRGAWIAAAVTLGGFALGRAVRSKRPAQVARWVGGVVLVGLFAYLTLGPASFRDRLGSIADLGDVSNYDRLCMAEAAMFMISERPLVGIGPEVVPTRYAIYRHPTAPRLDVPHLHNAFLQRAAELGLPYLGAYLWMLGAVLWVAWRRYRDEGGADGPRADLYLGTILVTVGFCVAGFFEDNWRDTEIRRLVLFLFALPLCPEPHEPLPSDPPSSADDPEI